jgi:hypothetical protein
LDLNQLFYRQQVSLMRADRAACVSSRHAHRGLASGYGLRIAEIRRDHDVAMEAAR